MAFALEVHVPLFLIDWRKPSKKAANYTLLSISQERAHLIKSSQKSHQIYT